MSMTGIFLIIMYFQVSDWHICSHHYLIFCQIESDSEASGEMKIFDSTSICHGSSSAAWCRDRRRSVSGTRLGVFANPGRLQLDKIRAPRRTKDGLDRTAQRRLAVRANPFGNCVTNAAHDENGQLMGIRGRLAFTVTR